LHEADILDQAVSLEIAKKSGAWYSFEGEKLGQGFEGTINYLKENSKLADKLEGEVRKAIATSQKN